MSFHFCLPERKCMDKKEGRHSVRIIVRMTENEYEKFEEKFEKAASLHHFIEQKRGL